MRGDQRVKTAIARTPSCLRYWPSQRHRRHPNRFDKLRRLRGLRCRDLARRGRQALVRAIAVSGRPRGGGRLVRDLFRRRRQREIDLEDGSLARV